jgi:hypothetical protein
MNTNNHIDLEKQFPELSNPNLTLNRIAEAFVAPEYARAAFGLIRELLRGTGTDSRFGLATVITAPHDYSNLIMTISQWWFLNFHIAESESLEEGDDVEEIVPLDYETVLDREKDDKEAEEKEASEANAEANTEANAEAGAEDAIGENDDDDDDVDFDDDDELIEATFYQVGTFLFDSTIIPHETIFDREDIDCYAYDYPEERISAERFYWARLVWEPEDLSNGDLVTALRSSMEFLLANHGDETPFAEHHDADFALLVLDEALCERALSATDFGDVIIIEGSNDEE